MNVSAARIVMKKALEKSKIERVKAYLEIEKSVHPVMRHFFFERFHSPDEWFKARTTYSRSVAVMSILGYMIGLGDRHCNNILIDSKSGEAVHIDFGYLFDQVGIMQSFIFLFSLY